ALSALDMRFWFKRAADELAKLGHTFVVSRDNPELYEYLRQEFEGEPITVILDRRQGGDGQAPDAPRGEGRQAVERRVRPRSTPAARAPGGSVRAPAGPPGAARQDRPGAPRRRAP